MSKQTEALKLALEALKELRMLGMNMQWHDSWLAKSETAITAIKEALTEQPQDSKKFDPNESFEREEAAKARVREFMRNH